MTVAILHILDARLTLVPVRADLRAILRDAVARVSEHADLPDFDLVARPATGADSAGGGVAAQSPAPGVIELTLDPARFDAARITRSLIRSMLALLRWEGPGPGRSLGEALVAEGLAGHFVLQVLGGSPDPLDATVPGPGLMRRALNEWGRRDHDAGEWFAGRGRLRRGTGHGTGHRILSEHLDRTPAANAAGLALAPAETFRADLRRLASADASVPAPVSAVEDGAEDGADPGPDPAP